MRPRAAALMAIVLAAGLAVLDLVRAPGIPGPFPWAWFAVSCAAALVVVGCVWVLADRRRRERIAGALAGLAGEPAVDAAERRRAVVAAIASTTVLGAIGLVLVLAAVDTCTGDDTKTVEAALAWHAHIPGGTGRLLPAEPRPPWMLAGLLSGGTVAGALLAARLLSLACGLGITLVVSLAAGTRAGPAAAIASAFALILVPNMIVASSYASEDAFLLLAFGGGTLLVLAFPDRPRIWPLVGLLAGLAGACKATGVVLVAVLVVALVVDGRVGRRTWPWLAAAVLAAAVPLLPHAYHLLWQGEVSRDSELLGLLTLHGPQMTRAKMAHDIPPFPGWGRLLVDTVGIMRVGDIVTGAIICFKPTQLWILPALVVPAVADPRPAIRRGLMAILVVVLPVLGLLGWKTGDAAEPLFLLGPAAALMLGLNVTRILRTLRRRPVIAGLVSGMVVAAIAEIAIRGLGIFS